MAPSPRTDQRPGQPRFTQGTGRNRTCPECGNAVIVEGPSRVLCLRCGVWMRDRRERHPCAPWRRAVPLDA